MTFTLNKSWHFWIANFAGRRVYAEHGSDICSYTRAFLVGLWWLAMAVVGSALLASFVVSSIWNTIDVLFFGGTLYPTTAVFWFLGIAIGILVAVAVFKDWMADRAERRKRAMYEEYQRTGIEPPTPQPGFLKLAYLKFKDKTCFRLEFK